MLDELADRHSIPGFIATIDMPTKELWCLSSRVENRAQGDWGEATPAHFVLIPNTSDRRAFLELARAEGAVFHR